MNAGPQTLTRHCSDELVLTQWIGWNLYVACYRARWYAVLGPVALFTMVALGLDWKMLAAMWLMWLVTEVSLQRLVIIGDVGLVEATALRGAISVGRWRSIQRAPDTVAWLDIRGWRVSRFWGRPALVIETRRGDLVLVPAGASAQATLAIVAAERRLAALALV